MSLATLKKKSKSTKNVKIGFKRRMNPSYSQKTKTDNHYDIKPSASYYNLNKKYNIYKNMDCDGDCDVVVAVEPDLTGEHRVEVLSTQHLKKENMEKMKHIKREPDERCHKKNELNYKDDDMSKTASSAQFVMKKKKACLIDPSVSLKTKHLFFIIKGRGSILTKMEVEVSFVIYDNSSESPRIFVLDYQFFTDAQGEAILYITADENGYYKLKNPSLYGMSSINHMTLVDSIDNRVLLKLKSTSISVDTDTVIPCIDGIDIKRDYEATLKMNNKISNNGSQTIVGKTSQDKKNINIGTTLISKLLIKNKSNASYNVIDDLVKIIGINEEDILITYYGQTFTSNSSANILKIDQTLALVDQLEKKSAVVDEAFDVMDVIQECIDTSTAITSFDFNTSSVITSTETQNVLNELKELTKAILESDASETNQTELINLITISNQDNDLYTEIEANFDEAAIDAAVPSDNISQYADISNILDVSSCY